MRVVEGQWEKSERKTPPTKLLVVVPTSIVVLKRINLSNCPKEESMIDYQQKLCSLWAKSYDELIERAYRLVMSRDWHELFVQAEFLYSDLLEASWFQEDEELVSPHNRGKIALPLRILENWKRKNKLNSSMKFTRVSCLPGWDLLDTLLDSEVTEEKFYYKTSGVGRKAPIRPGCTIAWIDRAKEVHLSHVVDHYYTEEWQTHYLQVEEILPTIIVDSKGKAVEVVATTSHCTTVKARHVYSQKLFQWLGEEAYDLRYS